MLSLARFWAKNRGRGAFLRVTTQADARWVMRQTETDQRAEQVRTALEAYEGPLLRYALRFTTDVETARDIVQDTFLSLCRAERVPCDGGLKAWLFTVCRNRALDLWRKERRMTPLDETQLRERPGDAPPASTVLERRERADHVLALVGALPERQQEVIRLKFQEGLSYREISEVTGHSVSHVGVLLHHAMATLRRRLSEFAAEA